VDADPPADTETPDWADQYGRYFLERSRADFQFRVTRGLVLVARRWRTRVDEELKGIGQTRSRLETLAALAFSGAPVSVAYLAHRAGVKWPTLVRMLNSLEADGLIRRFDNPDDGRSRLVELTPAGSDMLDRMQALINPLRDQLMQGSTDAEVIAMSSFVQRLLDGLGGDVLKLAEPDPQDPMPSEETQR
jgi:MarR family transcriptional regulator for hemolysin